MRLDRGRLRTFDGEAASRDGVRERAFAGIRWVTLARIVAEGLAFGSSVVLAHLISPAEFGHAVVALTLYAFATVLATRGFAAGLVQRKSVTRTDVEGGFFVSIASGIALTVALVLLAPIAFKPLFGAETARLLKITALAFSIAGLAAVPQALLLRRLDFRATSMFEVAGIAAGVGTSVALAAAGVNAEAIVIGALAGMATNALLALAATPVPLPRWRGGAGLGFGAFALPTGLSSLFYVVETNIDYVILGARLSPAQVGLYWRAYKLGVDYQRKITAVAVQMGFPIYSRSPSLEDMRAFRRRIGRLHATMIFPLMALFVPLAPVLIPWLFGSDWKPAVGPAQILAVGGIAVALGTGNSAAVLAAGRPWPLVAVALPRLVVLSLAVFLAAPYGLIAVSTSVAAVRVLSLAAAYHVLLPRLIGVRAKQLWADSVPGAVSSLPILIVGFSLTKLMSDAQLPAALTVLLVCLAGAAVYFVTLRAAFPSAMADVGLLARRAMERGTRHPDVTLAKAVS